MKRDSRAMEEETLSYSVTSGDDEMEQGEPS